MGSRPPAPPAEGMQLFSDDVVPEYAELIESYHLPVKRIFGIEIAPGLSMYEPSVLPCPASGI